METIPFINLIYLTFPLIIVYIFYKKWTGNKNELIYATLRMVLQLVLIGYLLLYLFSKKELSYGFITLLFMIIVSTFITIRNSKKKSLKEYLFIFISIFSSGILHLFIIIVFVLELTTTYEPRFVIPLAGMIFANCMNIISIAIERFEKDIEINSFEISRRNAFNAAMIPQINALLAVGLVSLPGMMTGQILSGVDPLIAVRYQIMIMLMVISSSGISLITYFLLKGKYNE